MHGQPLDKRADLRHDAIHPKLLLKCQECMPGTMMFFCVIPAELFSMHLTTQFTRHSIIRDACATNYRAHDVGGTVHTLIHVICG